MNKYPGYALITGGTSGIGLAFAKQLADKGYDLVIVSNEESELKSVKELIKNVNVIPLLFDLTNPKATDLIYDELQKKKIHVGFLIANAGFGGGGFFHLQDRNQIRGIIRILTMNPTELAYKFLPAMLEKGSGAIIFTSSISSQFNAPFLTVYASCKAFLLKLGVSLNAEYSGKGIDILTICPAWVDTKIIKDVPLDQSTLKILITPEDVATQSLEALGKKIVLNIFGKQKRVKMGVFLTSILPFKMMEKFMLKSMSKSL